MAGPPVGGYVVTVIGGSYTKEDNTIDQAKLEKVAAILGISQEEMPDDIQSIYVFRAPPNPNNGGGG